MSVERMFSRKSVRGFATAISLLAAAAPAAAGNSRGFENGGRFVRFDPVVAEYNESGEPFRIVGLCQSACTLFLSIRNVCVEPEATFQFHAGSDGKGNLSKSATQHMINAYNPKLQRFVIENGYMETFDFHTITGRDMIEKFGYPVCTAKHRLADNDNKRSFERGSEGSYAEYARTPPKGASRGAEGTYISR